MDNQNNYGYGQIVDGYAAQRMISNQAQMQPQNYQQAGPVQGQYTQPPAPPRVRAPIYPPINGRPITSEDEIVPGAIPMDGSVTYFPKVDFSEIIAKYWDKTGTLQEIRFIPAPSINQNGSQNGVSLDMVMAKLTEIENKINQKPYYPKKNHNKYLNKDSQTLAERTKEDNA